MTSTCNDSLCSTLCLPCCCITVHLYPAVISNTLLCDIAGPTYLWGFIAHPVAASCSLECFDLVAIALYVLQLFCGQIPFESLTQHVVQVHEVKYDKQNAFQSVRKVMDLKVSAHVADLRNTTLTACIYLYWSCIVWTACR